MPDENPSPPPDPDKVARGDAADKWFNAALDVIRFAESRATNGDVAATLLTHAACIYAAHQEQPLPALEAQIKYMQDMLERIKAAEGKLS